MIERSKCANVEKAFGRLSSSAFRDPFHWSTLVDAVEGRVVDEGDGEEYRRVFQAFTSLAVERARDGRNEWRFPAAP
jgi:hypothetical protein